MENNIPKDLTYLDLFSGCGGFAKGFQDAGLNITTHYFSEIEKHPIANYKYNFKDSIYVGDITKITAESIPKRPNIISFGFPCQDLSIAGNGAGLDGARSGLFFEAIRLIEAFKPEVFIFENVKGLLSSKGGSDFTTVLRTIANIGLYECEWQLCNTSWVLPQNRERVYFVGHLRGFSKPGIFPFREDGGIFNKANESKTRQSQTENCTTIKQGFGNKADDTYINVKKIARTLTGGGHSGGLHSDMETIKIKQINNKKEWGESVRQQDRIYDDNGIMAALPSSRLESKVTIKVNTKKGVETANIGDTVNYSNPKSKTRLGRVQKEMSPTIETSNQIGVVVKVAHISRTEDAKLIRKESLKNGKDYTPFQSKKLEWKDGEQMNTITCATQKDNLLNVSDQIRRLTEIECERLQGFKDEWTKFGLYDELIKEIPKTARYKMLGNAVTTNLPKMIAERLNFKLKSDE